MRGTLVAFLCCLGLLGAPAFGQETRIIDSPDRINVAFEEGHADEVERGIDLINDQKPAEAIAVFDPVITAYEADHGEGLFFCAKNPDEALKLVAVILLKESEAEEATILGPNWCDALFGKAFALVDLSRPDEAEPLLLQVVRMAPLSAHYRNELAELYKNRREWQHSFELFQQAYNLARDPNSQSTPRMIARALRGMGFCKIEMGQLAEAKSLFVLSQQHDPDSDAARSELEYIASLENKAS